MSKKKRIEWVILGRTIGTATGWDQADTYAIQLYDFEPVDGVDLPTSDCVTFDFERGTAETYDDNGKVTCSRDIVTALTTLPVEQAAA